MYRFKCHINVTKNIPANEKALRETLTLRAGCSTVEPENFRPAGGRRPLPEGAGRQKFKLAGDGHYL